MKVISVKDQTAFNSDQFEAIQKHESTKFQKEMNDRKGGFPPCVTVGLKSGASVSAFFDSVEERDSEYIRIVGELESVSRV